MPTDSEVKFYLEQIDKKLDGVNDRLDTLNSKTQKNTIDIAVMQALQAQAELTASKAGRNHGALWGSIGSFLVMIGGFIYHVMTGAPLPPLGQ